MRGTIRNRFLLILTITLGSVGPVPRSAGSDVQQARDFIASTNWTPRDVVNPLGSLYTGCVARIDVVWRDQTLQTLTNPVAVARLEDALRRLRFRDDFVTFRIGYMSTHRFWDAHHVLVAHTGVKTPTGEIHLLDAQSNIVGVANSSQFVNTLISNTLTTTSAPTMGNHPR